VIINLALDKGIFYSISTKINILVGWTKTHPSCTSMSYFCTPYF